MTDKKATITVVGRQLVDCESDITEISVKGTYRKTDKGYIAEYTDFESLEGSEKTVISVNGETMLMTKFGDVSTEMLFRQGERSNSDYITPFGNITIGIYTKKLESSLDENGGRVSLEYTIDFNSGFAALNELEITVDAINE